MPNRSDPSFGAVRPRRYRNVSGIITLVLLLIFVSVLSVCMCASARAQGSARLCGYVWQDLDKDGERGLGEPALGGVIVVLADAAGNYMAHTGTDGGGAYEFVGLGPGQYLLFETDPVGFQSTTPNKVAVVLARGEQREVHFGDGLLLTGCFRSVIGVLWADLDIDGVRDPGEALLDGVVVTVTDVQGAVRAITVAMDGNYSVSSLPSACYHLGFVAPATLPYSTLPTHWAVDLSDCMPTEIDIGFQDRVDSPYPCCASAASAPWLSAERVHFDPFAQDTVVSGTVCATGDGGPRTLQGVNVRLLTLAGEPISSVVSDSDGTYQMDVAEGGLYRVVQDPLRMYDSYPCDWGVVASVGSEVVVDFTNRPVTQSAEDALFLPFLTLGMD